MKIGIIGAGYVGRALAAMAVKQGHDAMISNSRGPHTLFSDAAMLGCKIGTIDEAAQFGDIVIVAVTFKYYTAVPVGRVANKIVIDTNNYYPQRDDAFEALDNGSTTSSELLAAHLPESTIVKAFNAIRMTDIERDSQPTGSFDRRALPLCGDDLDAKRKVSDLYDQFGFDTVDVGPLAEGWRFQPNTPAYCVRLNKTWLPKALAEAVR
ncbi:NADPH-dependent F420 reductase [Acerihabitans sp. TG2]|uniref:NADPH-dependent F420 reductase n=1 Tax=Acerihabitans sp. TG2 TaxID=3096008 RepID=UPI002B233BCC|nr:NADPH-dependent F420 reductase [Acerihabitans sp. TG2]MEA9391522.1 NADPH-dependent F420 reductase [Acerihabitans sp. TG2]